MEVINALIEERNAFETEPFLTVMDSNVVLSTTVHELQHRYDVLQIENGRQKEDIDKLSSQLQAKGPTKYELKQRDKIEKLEEQLYEKRNIESDLSKQNERNHKLDKTIQLLKDNITQKETKISQLQDKITATNTQANLITKQYDGFKTTIERLQNENETLSTQYNDIENRILRDKETFIEMMNKMNTENERLIKQIEMLTELNKQEKKRFIWSAKKKDVNVDGTSGSIAVLADNETANSRSRKFGGGPSVIVPTSISQKIVAHQRQTTSLRYDQMGADCIATASEDSTVKLWNTGNGRMLKSFRGGSNNIVLCLDMCGSLVAACGTDKMCRIWNGRTDRLIHQLVGHSQKVTSCRFLNGDKSILTASADRSMKVWDITRNTYRQTITLRHSSTSNCMDISHDSATAASGHLDGGVRFWDVRTSERTADITELHSNGVTSVKFNPTNNAEVLTAGRDSIVKLTDVRKSGEELQSFFHSEFKVDLSYAACAISPDGKYAAAGSSTGDIFIWRTVDGHLERQLKGHETGVVAVAWDRGGSNGQQFASVDKRGCLLLWA
jgi:autophagy-related protein 16